MTLSLANLKSFAGSRKKKKRVGRGNASGHGTYSGRGIKGQKARSGGKRGLKLKGFKRLMQNVPKLRGFKSLAQKPRVVNLEDLEEKFENGAIIDSAELVKAGLVEAASGRIKILGQGKLTKKFEIKADAFSASAKKAIEQVGGRALETEVVKNN